MLIQLLDLTFLKHYKLSMSFDFRDLFPIGSSTLAKLDTMSNDNYSSLLTMFMRCYDRKNSVAITCPNGQSISIIGPLSPNHSGKDIIMSRYLSSTPLQNENVKKSDSKVTQHPGR